MKYAVVDIETTGGSYKNDKITEIAIFVFDGERIVDEFVSLINPECSIPYHISRMTGITNQMVSGAPKFYQVAAKVVEITTDCIFVAHNATFDYNFIKAEFASLGYAFHRNTMCTVQMGRKHIPEKKSYSLGNICAELGISINGRHRAAGDALATVELLRYMQQMGSGIFDNQVIAAGKKKLPSHLHPGIDMESIDKIPDSIGVYFLIDENQDVIYVGKSLHIRSRIYEHLRNTQKRRSGEMASRIISAGYEATGSELMALIIEAMEIKKRQPHYNRLGRRDSSTWMIVLTENKDGYLCLKATTKAAEGDEIITAFEKKDRALAFLDDMIFDFGLCQKLAGRHSGKDACFHFRINRCRGACTGLESPESYNERVHKMLESDRYDAPDFYVITSGRHDGEKGLLAIKGGRFRGYGFFDPTQPLHDEMIEDFLVSADETRYIRNIIRSFIRENKGVRVIKKS